MGKSMKIELLYIGKRYHTNGAWDTFLNEN